MSSSESTSPIIVERRSSEQQTPAGNSQLVSPPPPGPAVSRSGSRHRAPAGGQSNWTPPAGNLPFTVQQSQAQNLQRPQAALGSQNPLGYVPSSGTLLQSQPHPPGYGNEASVQQPGALPFSQFPDVSQNQNNPVFSDKRKRLIVACDGTWKSADSAHLTGKATVPSNVVHLTRAIKSMSRNGISQVVFYQAGVGTDGGPLSRLIGGATAKGLEDDILQGYYWLCQNWLPGDEIFLIGFSRGAFTARSIAGMVDGLGLLTRGGIKHVNIIFKDFENRNNLKYRPHPPDVPFRRKPTTSDPRYIEKYAEALEKNGLTRLKIPIKAVAVFDTVGSLGIPRLPVLERLGVQSRGTKEYEFYDTSLGNSIEHAFQALALDEQRLAFSPSVWEKAEGNTTDLRQVWFPGVHTNIGGGYPDSNLSNITLAWMMAQLAAMLDFDNRYVLEMAENNAAYYEAMDEKPRPWSLGRLYNSLVGIWIFGGHSPRKPGMYTRVSPEGAPTDVPLRETREYVHASARSRFVLDGLGYRDAGFYRPKGLEGYRLRLTGTDDGQGSSVAVWESRHKDRKTGRRTLIEAPLFEAERQLLGLSPHVEHVVLRPQQAETEMNGGRSSHRQPRRREKNSMQLPAGNNGMDQSFHE